MGKLIVSERSEGVREEEGEKGEGEGREGVGRGHTLGFCDLRLGRRNSPPCGAESRVSHNYTSLRSDGKQFLQCKLIIRQIEETGSKFAGLSLSTVVSVSRFTASFYSKLQD